MTEFYKTPRVGDIVLYKLTEHDVRVIEERRGMTPGGYCGIGDQYPMIVTRTYDLGDTMMNGQVFLDGDDSYWVAAISHGEKPGQWQYREG